MRIKRGYLKCEEPNVVYGADLGQAVSVVSGKIRDVITSVLVDLGPVYINSKSSFLLHEYANKIMLLADTISHLLVSRCYSDSDL